jgi:hypothetical protein
MTFDSPPRRWTKMRIALLGGVLILAVLVGLAVIFELRAKSEQAEIDRRLDAIRAAGEPVSIAEIEARSPKKIPEKEVGVLLAPGLARLRKPNKINFHLGLPVEFIQPEHRDELAALLEENRPAMDLVPTTLNGCWAAPQQWSDPKSKLLGKLCWRSALALAESGQFEAAVKRMSQGVTISQMLSLSYRFDFKLVEQGLETLELILSQTDPPPECLKELESLLVRLEPPLLSRSELIEDRARVIEMLQEMKEDTVGYIAEVRAIPHWLAQHEFPTWLDPLAAELGPFLVQWSSEGYRDRDFVELLDHWARSIEALDQPPSARWKALREISELADKQQRRVAWTVGWRDCYVLAKETSRGSAQSRAARVALSILRWRAAHEGKLPDSLSELVPDMLPAIPKDPFDEQPLRYRRLPQGFTVYSVGPDFTDNGGQRQPAGTEKADGYDVVFSVGR